MYYFYVLKSGSKGQLYFGCTDDLRNRFKQHNSGNVQSTKNGIPWRLVYYEAYISKEDAYKREHNIKLRGNAYLQMKRRIKNCVAEIE